jgi:hyperosmotically inducible protein
MHKPSVLGSLTLLALTQLVQAADPTETGKKQVSKDPDVALTAEVKDALTDSGIAKTGEIQVETSDRVVQLSGFVDSESTEELALGAAKTVRGVESVRNDLVVTTSKPTRLEAKDDAVIAAKVRKQLDQQANTQAARDINVDVNEGVVQLSGFVDSVDDKNRAADLVASVAGVKDVRNDIALER